MCVFIFKLSSSDWVAAYWEIANHSANNMFSKNKCLIVKVFFHLDFWSGNNYLISPFLIIAYLYLLMKMSTFS